jgi:hypothetical protein
VSPAYHRSAVATVLALLVALGGAALLSAQARSLSGAPLSPGAGCGVVSCTTFLPLVLKSYPLPSGLEVTQAVQQPNNPVVLIQNRATFVRYTLTSTVAHAGVNAYLHGVRDGSPLPGTPIAALNNPRTLKTTADRGVLNDTFNFQLPASWLNGTIELHASATNGSTFSAIGGTQLFTFTAAEPLSVTVVPINYVCTNGSNSTLPGDPPYTYLTAYTYQTYPVPSVSSAAHAAITHNGPCTSGLPSPAFADWDAMLDDVTAVWQAEGSPDRYYYGLLHIDCSGGCIAGLGWIGWYKAAVGFDGFGPSHSGASETHAHEVGHNHGRAHAPGCGAGGPDPAFPYVPADGKAHIGDAAHPNYGFNISTQAIYAYSTYYDFMSYCNPEWISDYTYEALRQWNLTDTPTTVPGAVGPRALLVSGSVDPNDVRVIFRPAFALDAPPRLPDPGDHTIELLNADGEALAAYPFAPARAQADRARPQGAGFEHAGFHLALPYADGLASIRVRRGSTILGTLEPGARAPALHAGGSALSADGQSLRITWRASDADRDSLTYLVRASIDGGATWQVIGLNLTTPRIDLRPADFGGASVWIEVIASDGLHTQSLRLGPFAAPRAASRE